ncbi:metallophosphoesterase [Natronocalculus amylovorans]|uniref:Phosphoesterase n=1 Tax=Natronocalculus amylovorans TaxID=2917812 RepID=A0AAE3FVG6_9EURY|nr:metallophosphoesterase [Natronocalculus amylovorans]MCL9815705.1 metallophosphoesterase [Natronocalculus amylovorans]
MKLGIISDTHDDLSLTKQAVARFENEGVSAVIHCGDFIAPFTVEEFNTDSFDFYAVRGNNDGEWALWSTIDQFGTYMGHCGERTFDGVSIAVYHGTNAVLTNALVDCGKYDYVFHGHSHEHAIERCGETVRVNPGGIPLDFADDAFHIAIVETEQSGTDAVKHYQIG